MRIRGDQVMSVEQAKTLLGDEALSMTDEEIQQMIDDFDVIAQYAIKEAGKFKDNADKADE